MVCSGVTYHVKVIKMKWLPHLLWLPHLHVNLLEIFLPRLYWYQVFIMVYMTYYIHFEITCDPCHLIGSHPRVLFTNCSILCSKWHLFPSQWDSFSKKKTTDQILRPFLKKSIKLQENERQLCNFLQTSLVYWINKNTSTDLKNLYQTLTP